MSTEANQFDGVVEANFDGLVGPTHHYAGLSQGNIASIKNARNVANPKKAALQGLEKMKALHDLGLVQGVLPPHFRPNLPVLRSLGFDGTDQQVLDKAWQQAPHIAEKCFSASAMWTANAATVSPFVDTNDGLTHFTAANLSSMFHRSFEHQFTARSLVKIFANTEHFAHHQPLPQGLYFGDEGAANHTRLASSQGDRGLALFVYGAVAFDKHAPRPNKYPARQSLEASQAIARLHKLDEQNCVFAQQNPNVIDAGVFHNDVIAVGTTNLLFHHQMAFHNSQQVIEEISAKFVGDNFHTIEVADKDICVQRAIDTYLFNTQLLDLSNAESDNNFLLIAPTECEQDPVVSAYLNELVQSGSAIKQIRYFDLRESMKNGGGPACLRLRVPLSLAQINAMQSRTLIDDDLYRDLVVWVNQHYRDRLVHDDLKDPQLLQEVASALNELEGILNLEGLYNIN